MAGQLGSLVVEIAANISKFMDATDKTQVQMRKMAAQMNKTQGEISGNFKKMQASADTFATVFKGSLSFTAIAALTVQLFKAGVALERLETQFKTVFGSQAAGANEMAYIREECSRLGLELQTTAEGYAKFAASTRNTGIEGEKTRAIFTAVSEAVTAMKLSSDEANGIFLALSQMMSKGKVSAEEMNGQLGERLPGALKLAADAMGVTTGELMKMMQNGDVLAEDLLPKLADKLHETYGQAAVEASESGQGALNRFKNTVFDTASSIGQAFMPAFSFLTNIANNAIKGIQIALVGLQVIIVKAAAAWDKLRAGGWFSGDSLVAQKAKIDAAAQAQVAELYGNMNRRSVAPIALPKIGKTVATSTGGGGGSGKTKKGGKTGGSSRRAAAAKPAGNDDGMTSALDRAQKQVEQQLDVFSDLTEKYEKLKDQMLAFEEAGLKRKLDAVDVAEMFGDTSKTDAIKARMDVYGELLDHYKAKLADTAKGLPEWSTLQKEIADTGVKLRELNEAMLVQSGTVKDGVQQGVRDYLKSTKSMFEIGTEIAGEAASTMESAFSEMFFGTLTGKFNSFGDYLMNFLNNVGKSVSNMLGSFATNAIMGGVQSWFGGGGGMGASADALANMSPNASIGDMTGGVSNFTMAVVSGKRAGGGPVSGGNTYLVGEKGPELFTPDFAGSITPNHALAGGGGVTINIENKTGSEVKATQGQPTFDGKRWVKSVILELTHTDPQFRQAMRS